MRRLAILIGTVAATGAFAGTAQAAPGDLDPLFSGDGIVTTTFGPGGGDAGRAVAVQPDGKIVTAGAGAGDSVLTRHNPDGSPDTSFDGDGRATMAVGAGQDAFNALALQPDGKIVAVGTVSIAQNVQNFTVARFNPDGSPDTGFDGDGLRTTLVGAQRSAAAAVALQGTKIVVAGNTLDANSADDFAVVRYLADGTPDTSFSGDGIQTTAVGNSSDEAHAVAVQPDGKIVAGGYVYQGLGTTHDFALTRYNDDGTPDTGFDADGIVTTVVGPASDGISSVLIQGDGKIVAVGSRSRGFGVGDDFAAVRYDSGGTPDPSFSDDGVQTTGVGADGEGALDAALQPDGKIVAIGSSDTGSESHLALVRWGSDGTPDAAFSGDGTQTTDLGDLALGQSVALQPDGKIVAAGSVLPDVNIGDFDLLLARYQGADDPVPEPPAAAQPLPARPAAPATCRGLRATIVAKPGQSTTGTTGRDVILGTAGADRIRALGGNDVVCAGAGNDRIDGGDGDDRIVGGDGRDAVAGGDGTDRVTGGDGGDRITGGDGKDVLQGEDGGDRLSGQGADDRVSGGEDDDRVSGGKGRDRLWGRAGRDRISGKDEARDRVNCGDGRDVASLDEDDRSTNCE